VLARSWRDDIADRVAVLNTSRTGPNNERRRLVGDLFEAFNRKSAFVRPTDVLSRSFGLRVIAILSHRYGGATAVRDADARRATRKGNVLSAFELLVPLVILCSNLRRKPAVVRLHAVLDPAEIDKMIDGVAGSAWGDANRALETARMRDGTAPDARVTPSTNSATTAGRR
jgi:hypothetical protein